MSYAALPQEEQMAMHIRATRFCPWFQRYDSNTSHDNWNIFNCCTKRIRLTVILVCALSISVAINVFAVFINNKYRNPKILGAWNADESLRPEFGSSLSDKDTSDLLHTLDVFIRTMEAANLTYFMYGGTLIGSYRNHGLIPWDDDLDFLCDVKQKDQVYNALSKLQPSFKMFTGYQWKLYLDDPKIRYTGLFERHFVRWLWPFLDIFFYDSNATHIWDMTPWNIDKFVWKKVDIFPLKRRPFSYLRPFGPNHARTVLETNYNVTQCASNSMDHVKEVWLKEPKVVDCHVLAKQYPFVHRTVLSNGSVKEDLVFAGQSPIQTMIL